MLTRYRGILVVLGAVGLVWLGGLLQLFQAPDGWVYDLAVRTGGWESAQAPAVLMIETDPRQPLSTDEGLAILDYLLQLGARQVILLSVPETFDARFFQRAPASGRLILGHSRKLGSHAINTGIDASGPEALVAGSDLPAGDLSLPLPEYGVHRFAGSALRSGAGALPTLASVAALHSGGRPPDGEFRVNFNQGADWIPRFTVTRVLERGLIPELVAGRSALIGPRRAPAAPGLYTPLNASGTGMSLLEFQAYAIDTLLRDRPVRAMPDTLVLLLLVGVGLINLVVFQWFHLDRSSWFTAILLVGYLALGWWMLHGLQIWLPVVELGVAQVLMFWLFVRLKLLRDDQAMRHTVLRRMARLQEYMLPPGFYQLDEHWAQVINFVDQTLNLNRIIFLEKIEGDHRVREVQALRCSLDDIDERRRDFERTPYSDAIAEGGPIRLKRRLFFSATGDGDFEQYLVPLMFGGEVEGFWAFDVDPLEVESSESFCTNIRNFGGQLAELLYHRHRWIEQRNAETRPLRRIFQLEAFKTSSQDVNELLDLLDRRLQAVQAVFDGLATATIQYDLFGRVVQLNSSMEGFMQQHGLPGFKLTALDLLVEISGLPQPQVRRLLQQVVVDRRDFYIPARLQGGDEENYSVHIRPLIAGETAFAESAAPFELAGILIELSDERGLKRRYETREQFLEWVRLRLRTDLAALLEAEAAAPPAAVGSLQVAAGMGTAKLTAAVNSGHSAQHQYVTAQVLSTLEYIQRLLSLDWGKLGSGPTPADLYPLLNAAVAETRPVARDKRVQLQTDIPRLMGLVQVQAEQLLQFFRVLLEILLADAAADSELKVDVSEGDGALWVTFRNSGFGIPDEHLQSFVWEAEHEVTDEFKDLRMAVQPLAEWGGELQIHSEIGVGIWASLRLPVVS
ncbi:MAG: CHASE2 domain-containing protein [Sedimenticolaceae bacterium]